MKVSARNVFNGRILKLQAGAVNAEVTIDIGGGDLLVSIITLDSVKSLGLATGKDVVALIKAPWVMLMTEASDIRLSARNCLKGTVKAVAPGSVNSEVTLTLPGGNDICAIVTRESVTSLGLGVGVPAVAVIKASSIILGVSA